ncbi:hypothetical protein LCGC14_1291570 [marine sediment metagenome]|uniref:Uncharacterized protein n=1 Tax=marine sediment metagenome TaxID=412755 RepID=A0A0F9LD23_9ZZZZ
MPKGNTYGNLDLPSGKKHIERFGPSESALAQFLFPFAWRDVTFIFDDFTGGNNQEATVADFQESLWQDGNYANGTSFRVPATQLAGGVCQGVTGAVGTDTTALWGMHTWLGDQSCGMEMRYKIDNLDDVQFEIGFSDPYADQKETGIADIDTPTFTSGTDDVALIGMDTSEELQTQAFVTDGSTGNMNATKTNLGTRTPTNATYQVVRIQLERVSSAVAASNGYIFDQNGWLQEQAHHGAVLASQIKGDVLLGPLIVVEAVTTSARTTDIDYLAVWQERV